jgi:acyl carrier protein
MTTTTTTTIDLAGEGQPLPRPTMEKKMEDTFTTLARLIVEQLGCDADQVKHDAALVDDLGCDSLDIVEMVMTVEEEFKIEIPDDDAEKFQTGTVGDLVEYVEKARAPA